MNNILNEIGLKLLNGAGLRSGDLRLPIAGGAVNGKRVLEMAEAEVAARLFGLSLPDSLRLAVLRRLGSGNDDFLSIEFKEAELQKKKIQEYLIALAEELEDDPLVVLILDGSAIQVILDDEDKFAKMAEKLFTDMDTNNTGKVSKSKIKEAPAHLGVEMDVPSFCVCDDLFRDILKKHGAEGEQQLGQAQFARLLRPILQDLADALTEKRVAIIQSIKIVNGSRLKKILNDKKALDDITGRMFHEWQEKGNGAWNKETVAALLRGKGSELCLPPHDSNVEIEFLYDLIFSSPSREKPTEGWTRESFQDELKIIFKMFADLLKEDPIFMNRV